MNDLFEIELYRSMIVLQQAISCTSTSLYILFESEIHKLQTYKIAAYLTG